MIEFKITDSARQKFSTAIDTRRITIKLSYSHTIGRWSFDLAIDGDYVLHGRRVIPNVDLIEPFNFGVGSIFAFSDKEVEPDKNSLINGALKLYQVSRSELDAALA